MFLKLHSVRRLFRRYTQEFLWFGSSTCSARIHASYTPINCPLPVRTSRRDNVNHCVCTDGLIMFSLNLPPGSSCRRCSQREHGKHFPNQLIWRNGCSSPLEKIDCCVSLRLGCKQNTTPRCGASSRLRRTSIPYPSGLGPLSIPSVKPTRQRIFPSNTSCFELSHE